MKLIIKELNEKYDIYNKLKEKYDNNVNIETFSNKFFVGIENLETICYKILALFKNIWNDEKKETIIEILSLILYLERESLKIKKLVLGLILPKENKNLKDKNLILENDKHIFLDILEKIKNDNQKLNNLTIDINLNNNNNNNNILLKDLLKNIENKQNELKDEIDKLYKTLFSKKC
jgi:hypothetical protein